MSEIIIRRIGLDADDVIALCKKDSEAHCCIGIKCSKYSNCWKEYNPDENGFIKLKIIEKFRLGKDVNVGKFKNNMKVRRAKGLTESLDPGYRGIVAGRGNSCPHFSLARHAPAPGFHSPLLQAGNTPHLYFSRGNVK